jgi:MOSC domain-containing protein YiiM
MPDEAVECLSKDASRCSPSTTFPPSRQAAPHTSVSGHRRARSSCKARATSGWRHGSVTIGERRTSARHCVEGSYHTHGIWKTPVCGRCRVGRLNLDGDGQGDLAGHGGEQRAVFVYQIKSYRYWQDQLKRSDFVHGQLGENFTIERLPDDAACIGDRYQIGSALFEITQPRVTCYRVGIRMNEPRMPALLTSNGRPGFYFRVLQEGEVGAGDEIVKVGETTERMTIAEINALLYSPNHPRDRLERALRIAPLSPGWRSSFEAFLQSQATAEGSGNAGLAPAAAAHPVAPGFRRVAVAAIDQECADVLSLTMQSLDGRPLPTALPGQYVVLRLPRTPGDATRRRMATAATSGSVTSMRPSL